MTENVRKFWEARTISCSSTTIPKLITKLYGGESITLKSHIGSKNQHWIGSSKDMTTTDAYSLDKGETVSLTLPATFGMTNFIEIWALPETAGDNICYVRLYDLDPSTQAGY